MAKRKIRQSEAGTASFLGGLSFCLFCPRAKYPGRFSVFVFCPGRQILDDSQGFWSWAPNPRRSQGFQVQVPDLGLSMLVWHRPQNIEKLCKKVCWRKTVQIERFRDAFPPFSAVGSFWASSSLFSSFSEASKPNTNASWSRPSPRSRNKTMF